VRKLSFKVLLLIGVPLIVFAHRVDLFPNLEGNKLEIWGYFSDGTPAQGADVKIYSSNGSLIFEGKTDKEGHLIWQIPKGISKIKIVLYAGLGHKAETTVVINKNETALNGKTATTNTETKPASSTHEVANIGKPKEHIPWFKAFCGVGWILGIFGLWNFFTTWRSKKS